jgi:glycosyltransferase involved in cell wall biosynthesis
VNGASRLRAGSRIVFLSNALEGPDDEATRRFARVVAAHASGVGIPVVSVSQRAPVLARALLLSPRILGEIRGYGAATVVYLPTASASVGSFLRAGVLRACARVRIVLIALQPSRSTPCAAVARACRPDLVLTPSTSLLCALRRLQMRAAFLPMGVDAERFHPVDEPTKGRLRRAYGLPEGGRIVLHVGHLQPLRNLAWISRLPGSIGATVVVVGGTAMGVDPAVSNALAVSGVRLINRYLPRIEELYQLADGYVFPVVDGRAAIGVPLSVLEAMACDLPVVTTPFGGLPRMLSAGDGLSYATTADEFVAAVSRTLALPPDAVRTREKVLPYSWQQTVRSVFDEAAALAASPDSDPALGSVPAVAAPARGRARTRRR